MPDAPPADGVVISTIDAGDADSTWDGEHFVFEAAKDTGGR